jgi:hypothetical protein
MAIQDLDYDRDMEVLAPALLIASQLFLLLLILLFVKRFRLRPDVS